MKKYILYFFIITIVYMNNITSCPFSFSPKDQRSFFEQYQDASIQPDAHSFMEKSTEKETENRNTKEEL